MLTLNIIPKSLKDEIKLQITYLKLKNLLAFLLFLALIYSTAFVALSFVLEMHSINLVHRTNIATRSNDDFSKQVRSINSDVGIVESIQSGYTEWSYMMENLMKTIPRDISISQFTANKNTNLVTINGLARTRDSLLDLKELLEASPNYENVEFPIKNLLQKENINFTITAQLASYEFKD